MLGIGAVVILGAAFLPIEPHVVQRYTAEKLARGELAALLPDDAPPELPVRLVVSGEPAAAAALAALATAPVKEAEGRRVAHFRPVEGAAPELRLSATEQDGQLAVTGELGEKRFEAAARVGRWTALLPPLVALVLALALRRVVPALFVAVLVGAAIMQGSLFGMLWLELKSLAGAALSLVGAAGLVEVEGYFGKVLADSFNLQILGFTLALVGLVAVVGRMGGTRGLVNRLSVLARGPRSAQAVTALMGMAIFFDDYANTLVVGTTGRSLTDGRKISREKLAYIVDSTSAPVAGIAIISTWIGYEVGLFDDLLGFIRGVPGVPDSGYELFFEVLPLRFYCIFALLLVFLVPLLGRDLGPMYRAERRARSGGPVRPDDDGTRTEPGALEKPGVTPRALNAILPIGTVLVSTLVWIVWAGSAGLEGAFSPLSLASWKSVFDTASDDIATILLGSAALGGVMAFVLAIGQRLLTAREAFSAYGAGMGTLAEAVAILIGAWAIKSVCDDLGTGMAIVALIGDALPAVALPLVIFALSGAIAFATGTSWGTMALVLPVAAPLAAAMTAEPLIVLACLGAVLDGAIWGDHCSPISDTTVLSSTASGCPHLAHVQTQLPYATLAMLAAGACGYLGTALGLPIAVAYGLGLAVMAGGLLLLGKNPDADDARRSTMRSADSALRAQPAKAE